MPLLNAVRCQACSEELHGDNWNNLCYAAEQFGWLLVRLDNEMTTDKALCPEHHATNQWGEPTVLLPAELAWAVECDTCEWEEDCFSEEEAKVLKRRHDCNDYRDDFPCITITSPDERIASAQRTEKFLAERRAEKKAEEKQTKEAERQRLGKEQALLDEVQRLRDTRKRHPWVFKILDALDRNRT